MTKTYPKYSIKVKRGDKWNTLANLFENTAKGSGKTYLSGKTTDKTEEYKIFTNDDGSHVLKKKGAGGKLVKLCDLTVKQTKDGQNYMTGGDEAVGGPFSIFSYTPKK